MSRTMWISSVVLLAACGGKDQDTAVDENALPVADAGDNVVLQADQAVELDGRASFDSDGDALTYHWSFDRVPDGSGVLEMELPFVQNHNRRASTTSFHPDAVGTYVISLEVDDGTSRSAADFVVVTAQDPESRPVANAGVDLQLAVGASATLDGSASYDGAGRDLAFAWAVVEAPAASSLTATSMTGGDSASPTWEIDAKGVYILNLVVDNGLAKSEPDAVVITAFSDDNEPVANAGSDLDVEDCTWIQLDGSNSADPDADALQYFWELQSKPTNSVATNNSFSDRREESPTFWADVAGTFTFSLAVSDGNNWSTADGMTMVVEERAVNTPPTVIINPIGTVAAGEAECATSGYSYDCDDCETQSVTIGDTVAVVDVDNDPYTVQWELISGSGSIADTSSLITTLLAEGLSTDEPYYCNQNQFVLGLTVTDCTGESTQANTTLSAECCGIPSTAR